MFACYVRSNLTHGLGIEGTLAEGDAGGALGDKVAPMGTSERQEIDYVRILNRVLPSDIRVRRAAYPP